MEMGSYHTVLAICCTTLPYRELTRRFLAACTGSSHGAVQRSGQKAHQLHPGPAPPHYGWQHIQIFQQLQASPCPEHKCPCYACEDKASISCRTGPESACGLRCSTNALCPCTGLRSTLQIWELSACLVQACFNGCPGQQQAYRHPWLC